MASRKCNPGSRPQPPKRPQRGVGRSGGFTQVATEAKINNVSVELSQVDNDHQAQVEASVVTAKAAVEKAPTDKFTYPRSLQACHEAKAVVPKYAERVNAARLERQMAIGVLRVDIDTLQKRPSPP